MKKQILIFALIILSISGNAQTWATWPTATYNPNIGYSWLIWNATTSKFNRVTFPTLASKGYVDTLSENFIPLAGSNAITGNLIASVDTFTVGLKETSGVFNEAYFYANKTGVPYAEMAANTGDIDGSLRYFRVNRSNYAEMSNGVIKYKDLTSTAINAIIAADTFSLPPTYWVKKAIKDSIAAHPGGGSVSSVLGTSNRISSTGGANPVIDIDPAYVGQSSIQTVGNISSGSWLGSPVADAYISSAATWNAKQGAISLTTTGTSGAATFIGNVLNIPQYSGAGGSGTVTDVSVVSANGFSGSVATSTTTPAITIGTTLTGIVKGNGTSLSAAVAGTDYVTGSSTNTFTNKSGNNSQWTNDAGFITSVMTSVVTKSANFTVLTTEKGILFDVTTGASNVTVTFPSAASAGNGFSFYVRKADTGTGFVLSPSISASLPTGGSVWMVHTDGTTWFARTATGAYTTAGAYFLGVPANQNVTLNITGSGRLNLPYMNSLGVVVNDASGNLTTSLSLGNVDVTTQARATNSTKAASTAFVKLRDAYTINVKDYGAVGDGVTNDAASIISALAAASVSQTVYFPDGNYLIGSTTIPINKTINILGAFASITVTGNVPAITITANNVKIEHIRILGSGKSSGSTAQHGISSDGFYYMSYRQIECYNMGGAGIYIKNTNVGGARYGARLNECYFNGNNIGYLADISAEYITSTNCYFQYNNTGVIVRAGNNSFNGGSISDNTTCGVKLEGSGLNALYVNDGHGIFSGVLINHNKNSGAYTSGYNVFTEGITLGYTFSGCHFYDSKNYIKGSTGIEFIGCHIAAIEMIFENSNQTLINNNWLYAGYGFTITNNANSTTSKTYWLNNHSTSGGMGCYSGYNISSLTNATAGMHLAAGTATASTAPLKFTAGTNLTTPEAGAMEPSTSGTALLYSDANALRHEIMLAQQTNVSTQFDATTTTLSNITGLTATVTAGKKYRFRAVLFLTPDITGGLKVAIGGTATATSVTYQTTIIDNTSATLIGGRSTSLGSSTSASGSTNSFVTIEGFITVNAGGTLTAQFAQNSTSGTSSVLVNSNFIVTPIN